ncbi:EmrB/QacA subfamily drug resistance transporter [Pandoraea terrae]|uniref:EmrB/QacA subfamily drug resistance transporter n=1 Tax=Pandoraea terrae TaxID=1537710 RepID=A0A5E4UNV4_9BURK|nr:DHA2 family efflux MFS transporter permease subunit [Pandoraea terrae]VVE00769.1 EmrB/QacA subfamily drug resistance transporter [Pandoraea terrae]
MANAVPAQGAGAGPAAPAGTPVNASASDWIAVAAGALGALLATLDISITNSALPQIQGQIGASGTEGTWISTGYLMSEIVMIPLAAWLTRVFGMRRFLMWNAILFTAFSMMCGLSHSLPEIVIGRIGQGFAGGAMIPTAQTIIRTRLPRHQMAVGMAAFGLIVMLGPVMGPVFGGWLTENANWRWCFFLNLPISTALVLLLYLGLKSERADFRQFINADWLGIVGLTIGLSSLTVVLEEGQREHWFDSTAIVWLSIVAAVGIGMVLVAQFTSRAPIVRLALLRNKNYASVIFIVFTIGAAIYGVSYLLPQFLALIAGYNAQQAGGIMLLAGIPAMLLMPILPRLITHVDIRLLVIAGLLAFLGSCMLDLGLTTQSAGHDFTMSQLLRGVGQMLAMMPLNQAAMAAVGAHEAGDAAGLYNMARNLGGSVGLALLGIFIDRRVDYHDAVLREGISANSAIGQEHLSANAAGFFAQHGDMAHAKLQAMAQLAGEISRQAMVITYSETFYVLGVALLLCVPLALLLKQPAGFTSGGH